MKGYFRGPLQSVRLKLIGESTYTHLGNLFIRAQRSEYMGKGSLWLCSLLLHVHNRMLCPVGQCLPHS